MILFISKYVNNLDAKGRVSVPAAFRANLVAQGQSSIVLYPSIKNPCIEGCSITRLEHLAKLIANLDPYSEERDAFEAIILGESHQLSFDNHEGRIVLPKELISCSELSSKVVFVGKGEVFEIWDCDAFEKYMNKAKNIAIANKGMLKNL